MELTTLWEDPTFWNAVTCVVCIIICYRPVKRHLFSCIEAYHATLYKQIEDAENALYSAKKLYNHARNLQQQHDAFITTIHLQAKEQAALLTQQWQKECELFEKRESRFLEERLHMLENTSFADVYKQVIHKMVSTLSSQKQKELHSLMLKVRL